MGAAGARRSRSGREGAVYLPYLSESGIIAPVADARARAQFAGLMPVHGREAMIRAVYEGVAFSIADLCDLLAPPAGDAHGADGRRRAERFWCRMIAEVTGREVVVPEGAEFGARGAALLAATALGRFGSVTEASAAVAGGGTAYAPTGDGGCGLGGSAGALPGGAGQGALALRGVLRIAAVV